MMKTKVYSEIRLDMNTGRVLNESFSWYEGPLVLLKGGGQSTNTVTKEIDYEYNRRMAEIAERQQAMAEEYMDFWRDAYKPMEEAQIAANVELMPLETEYAKAQLTDKLGILPEEEKLRRQELAFQTSELGRQDVTKGLEHQVMQADLATQLDLAPVRKEVASSFYEQALNGVNVRDRMNMAGADVARGFSEAEAANRREAMRMGLNPASGRFADQMRTTSLDRARGIGAARTTARREAEDERFKRASAAMNFGGV